MFCNEHNTISMIHNPDDEQKQNGNVIIKTSVTEGEFRICIFKRPHPI